MIVTLTVPQPLTREKRITLRSYVDNKRSYFLLKRVMDVLISLAFIVFVLSWLLPILAVMIRINSRGPVFFLQKRVGRGGRSFTCIKFRTMVLNKEADKKRATQNDERVTRLGKFLRTSNIDEFPQFFNVLAGSMSIVGPRPHMHADCNSFSSILPGYKFRNMVKPGITGLAQVKGFHGAVISRECISRRFQWDAFYIRNISFWMDTRIIISTAVKRMRYILSL